MAKKLPTADELTSINGLDPVKTFSPINVPLAYQIKILPEFVRHKGPTPEIH